MATPRPVPTALKILRGNPGKRPLPKNEPKPEAGLPDPPEWMNDKQRESWNYLGGLALQLGVMTRVDGPMLELATIAHATLIEAAQKTATGGIVWIKEPETKGDFPRVAWSPYWAVQNRAMKQLETLLGEFGMSPSSRTKVQALGEESKGIATRNRSAS